MLYLSYCPECTQRKSTLWKWLLFACPPILDLHSLGFHIGHTPEICMSFFARLHSAQCMFKLVVYFTFAPHPTSAFPCSGLQPASWSSLFPPCACWYTPPLPIPLTNTGPVQVHPSFFPWSSQWLEITGQVKAMCWSPWVHLSNHA